MDQRTLVWIRAGARCAICNRYLLDENLGAVVPVGENAHIVGREQTAKSPRGLDPLPAAERDKAENLVLLCREQHKLVDSQVDLFTVDELRRLKRAHEDRVRRVTEIGGNQQTTVLRVVGNVRGATASVDRGLVAEAVVASQRYPHYSLAHHQDGLEVSLRSIPDEGSPAYYRVAKSFIDDGLTRLADGLRREAVRHVSLFAFARLPLLVYLGSRLDDAFEVDIYQRHRHSQAWVWDERYPAEDFEVTVPETAPAGTEAALVLNLSGTIQSDELPGEVRGLPRYVCAPANKVPHPDILAHRASLSNLERTLRDLLAGIESSAKRLEALHLFSAIPISAAVVMGRILGPSAPKLLVYDENGGTRRIALEVNPS